MPNSNIVYSGEVSIHVKGTKTKLHNQGTDSLFSLVHQLLAYGSKEDTDVLLPSYITITQNDTKITNFPAPCVSKKSDKDNLVLSFVLNKNNMYSKPEEGSAVMTLLGSDKNTALAIVTLDSDSLESLVKVFDSPYGQAIIDWSLSFGNVNKSEEN